MIPAIINHASQVRPVRMLRYSYNWNKKLNCRFHTTIRPDSPFYVPGEYFCILLGDDYLFKGRLVLKQVITLSELQPFTAVLDTGYSLEETIAIIKEMYPAHDWATEKLAVLLIENLEWEQP